jgi:hypothetical protein
VRLLPSASVRTVTVLRLAIVVITLVGIASPASADRSGWSKHPLGFFYQAPKRTRQAGVPRARVAMFAAPSGPIEEARFVVALQDPEDDKIVIGGDADWVSVAARAYSEVRRGKLVPHVRFAEPCDDGDPHATCYPGRAEYLLARRDGWETEGAMYAIVRERGPRRFLVVGYSAKRSEDSDMDAAAARAKELAFSIRFDEPS